MATFQVYVEERATYIYTIEAGSIDEAEDNFAFGEKGKLIVEGEAEVLIGMTEEIDGVGGLVLDQS